MRLSPEDAPRPTLHFISSRRRDRDAEQALYWAFQAARGIDHVLPVITPDGCLGHVHGRRGTPHVWYRPWDGRVYDCAITTYNGVVSANQNGFRQDETFNITATSAGIAYNWYDMFGVNSKPTGTYTGTAYTAKQWNDGVSGAMYHGGDVSTQTKYISRMLVAPSANAPVVILYDRVLSYEACSFNAAVNQAFTNGVAAQRYISAGEFGLQVIVTAQTALGASASAFTRLKYTDNGGNASQDAIYTAQVANIIVSAAARTTTLGARVVSPVAAGATTCYSPFYPLGAGDTGVRLLEDFTTDVANTGTLCFVLGYPLAICPTVTVGAPVIIDQIIQTSGMSIVKDGAYLDFLNFQPATTANTVWGNATFIWG